MESRFNYTLVGIFVIGLIFLFFTGFFWLSIKKHDIAYKTYVVYLHEEVSGLSEHSNVRFNGVSIGFVKTIELDPKNPQLVKLTLELEQKAPITTSTVATLKSQGITGVAYIGLEAENMNSPGLTIGPGEKYPVIPSRPSWFMQISEVLPVITTKITELSDNVNKMFDDKNQKAMSQSLENINKFSKTLSDNSEALDKSMHSLQVTLSHAEVMSKDLPAISKQVQATLSQVRGMSAALEKTSQFADKTMRSGKVAVDNFSAQVMPTAQETMQKLNVIAANLQVLSQQLQRNPSMLIRGKQAAVPGPGEK